MAQDMAEKDKYFVKEGYEDSGMTMPLKPTSGDLGYKRD
jgi:hypothetical protein